MGVFDQMGDPVCPSCLCQHHEAAYAEFTPAAADLPITTHYTSIANDAVIVQVQITITETCCVIVNAATAAVNTLTAAALEIERPLGTIRTQQRDAIVANQLALLHHATWEILPPGVYTYFLVNRKGSAATTFAAWIKAIASDCEG